MNILFTICGRAGSKGCKNKNIREFLGKPLFEYTFNAIDEYKKKYTGNNIDIAVSTDSVDFIRLLGDNHDCFIIDRASDLAGDKIAKMQVISDALIKSEKYFNKVYDIIVDLDITSPIRSVDNINEAINKQLDGKYDCVFSVTGSRRNPYFNMVTEKENTYSVLLKSTFTTRQEAPQLYDMNASIYAYSREYLLSGNITPISNHCSIIFMKDTGIIDIDNAEDFELMEVLATYFANTYDEYNQIFKLR